jgi:ABC-type lipoprotein release transport system permease subunit
MGFPMVGVVIGLIAALMLGRLLQAVLYEVKPTDPVVLAGTVILLLAVSLLACFSPAMRATREDPLDSLRSN